MRLATTHHRRKGELVTRRMVSLGLAVLVITGGIGIFLRSGQAAEITHELVAKGAGITRRASALVGRLTGIAVAGTISGTVFDDKNGNGEQDTGEPGLTGVTVTGTDNLGNVVTATTNSSGNYSLASLPGSSARVEFGMPPSQSGSPGDQYSPTIAGGTTVRFLTLSGNLSAINAGFINRTKWCSNNQNLAVPCWAYGLYNHSSLANEPVLVGVPYNTTNTRNDQVYLAKSPNLGSAWGLAFQESTGIIYATAVIRRHTDTGPRGLAGLYALKPRVSGATEVWSLDLNTLSNTFGASFSRDIATRTTPSHDSLAFDKVGKTGIGDIDLSEDGNTLWVVNLEARSLVRLDVTAGATPTSATSFTLDNGTGTPTCTNGVLRPWGLKLANGKGYLGVVCTGENATGTPTQARTSLSAHVLSFDPAATGASMAFTQVLNITDMTFQRGIVYDGYTPGGPLFSHDGARQWNAWRSSLNSSAMCAINESGPRDHCIFPTPILSDIEFDDNGNMIIGFIDRLSIQMSGYNYGPLSTDTDFYQSFSGGDIMRACLNNGTYQLESNGVCGGVTGSGSNNAQGPGGGEFYGTETWGRDNRPLVHNETAQGGLALLKGASPSQVVSIIMDPLVYYSGGLTWFSNVDGSRLKSYEIYQEPRAYPSQPGGSYKATGLGDVELYCPSAPLELGDRVWHDKDGDGVQDPGEQGIDGLTVELYKSGTKVGTTTTQGGGLYLFNDLNVTLNGASGLLPNMGYEVRVSTLQSGITTPGYIPTAPNVGGASGDSIDSDGVFNVDKIVVTLTTGENGENNHTYDIGLTLLASIGNLVFNDINNNGLKDANEPGINGVVVELYTDVDTNNVPDTVNPISRTTTATVNGVAGLYLFTETTINSQTGATLATPLNLAPGNYIVSIPQVNFNVGSVLEGMFSSGYTLAANGTPSETMVDPDFGGTGSNPGGDQDDNGYRAVSGMQVLTKTISITGQEPLNESPDNDPSTPDFSENLTIDFGFYAGLSVGNSVFADIGSGASFNNGQIDAGDVGIAGVTVRLLAQNGTTQLASTVTDANGKYLFAGLPAATYYVDVLRSGPLANMISSYNGSNAANTNATDSDDNGKILTGTSVRSVAVILTAGDPTATGEADQSQASTTGFGNPVIRDLPQTPDANSNLKVDFGFIQINRMKIGAPPICIAPGGVIEVTVDTINTGDFTQPNNTGPEMRIDLPVSITAVLSAKASTNSSGPGTLTVNGINQILWNGTLNSGDKLTIVYRVQIGDHESGTQVCSTSITNFDADVDGSNESMGTVDVCTIINCPPLGSGNLMPSTSTLAAGKPGSVLIYNIYTSTANNDRQNTQFNLTNAHSSLPANVHLFFVDGATCAVADQYVSLTPAQTTTFYASDLDPGTTGYVIAVAVDEHGCPASFNYLIGDEYVWFESGHAANLGAISVAGLPGGLPPCDTTSTTATLNFDGIAYNPLPRTLALDSISSRADGSDTMIVLNRMGGNLLSSASTLGSFFGLLYDDQEVSASFNIPAATCQLRGSLSGSLPRTAPRFETMIPAGRVGWMKFWQVNDVPITGAAIRYRATGAHQGHNLHVLTTTNTGSFTIPVFPVP